MHRSGSNLGTDGNSVLLLECICQEMPRRAKTQAPWGAQTACEPEPETRKRGRCCPGPRPNAILLAKSWVPTGATVPSQCRTHYPLFITVFTCSAHNVNRRLSWERGEKKQRLVCIAPQFRLAAGVQIWNHLTRSDPVDVLDCRASSPTIRTCHLYVLVNTTLRAGSSHRLGARLAMPFSLGPKMQLVFPLPTCVGYERLL